MFRMLSELHDAGDVAATAADDNTADLHLTCPELHESAELQRFRSAATSGHAAQAGTTAVPTNSNSAGKGGDMTPVCATSPHRGHLYTVLSAVHKVEILPLPFSAMNNHANI